MAKIYTTKPSSRPSSRSPGQQVLKQKPSELRIIGGKWRSRKISFIATEGLRPSPARIRETLFNWLSPSIADAHCLDLFSGSGALGFEALSRGAASVTMVELNQQVVRQLTKNKEALEADNLVILNQDASELCSLGKGSTAKPFDIIFCDPPFNLGFVQPLIDSLKGSELIGNTKIYIETEKSLQHLELPKSWCQLKEKVAGDVRYRLLSTS